MRDDEPPHPLDRRQLLVDPRDDIAERLVKAGIAGERRQIADHPMLLREAGGEFGVGHDDRDQIRPAVAEHHRLGDLRGQRQRAFDPQWRDHVAAGILDEVALPIGDVQIPVGIEMADIAGVQPAIGQRARRSLRIVPVALHDIVAGDQDLAVLGDPDLDPVECRPDAVDPDPAGWVAGDDRRRLGLAVALQ